MKPFLKWAGSKQSIADEIVRHLPDGERLVEPFCGSAAIFAATDYERYWLNDINEDLIRLYAVLRDEQEAFLEEVRTLFTPEMNTEERYYALRDEFNELMADLGELDPADRRRRAAIFVYMNRHGYNGLCRYNQQGGFNVPFGRYRQVGLPEERLAGYAAKLSRATLTVRDFEDVMAEAGPGDVVYCDPPYLPLSSTASFTSYAKGGFGPDAQERLARAAEACAGRGVPVLVSNHDTPAARTLYREAAHIHAFPVQRYISAKGSDRKKVREIVAVFGVDPETARRRARGNARGQLDAFEEAGR